MSKENHITLILNDLKLHYNFKSNTDFAKFLGIAPQTLSSWYSRCSVDYDLIYAKCVDIDANWLLTGTGSMLRSDTMSSAQVSLATPIAPAPAQVAPAAHVPQAPDASSMHYIMQRYESLVAENALLKKENEELKHSRGTRITTPSYDISEKIGTQMVAEPRAHK